MLVLRRKAGEGVTLSTVIHIEVLGIEGDQVKLAIDAPADVVVSRDELLDPAFREARERRRLAQLGPMKKAPESC